MSELLIHIDRLIFNFINQTLANPIFDWLMPFLTDLNKSTVVLILVGLIWLFLVIKGGKTGRIVAFGLIFVVALSDQFNSSILKSIFDRDRPCHFIEGVRNVEAMRLLVGCGTGRSFPSSHAANMAAGATLLWWYYPRAKWYFIGLALLIGFSRIYVGVHFPIDVLAGFIVGIICGFIVIGTFMLSEKIYFTLNRFITKKNDS